MVSLGTKILVFCDSHIQAKQVIKSQQCCMDHFMFKENWKRMKLNEQYPYTKKKRRIPGHRQSTQSYITTFSEKY